MSKSTDLPAGDNAPMPCVRTTDLGAYLLGGMSETESRDMRVHIDTCTWCSQELSSLRPVADLFDSTELASSIIGERLEPTPDVASRLFARADAELASAMFTNVHSMWSPTPQRADARFSAPRPKRRALKIAAAGAAVFSLGVGSTIGTQQLVAGPSKPKRAVENVRFATVALESPSTPTTVPIDPKMIPKAWATIDQTAAGTYAYLYVRDFEVGKVYRWWFIKRDGSRVPLGSFRYPGAVDGDEWLRCPGHTAFNRSELIAIGATNEEGFDVVRQDLPAVPKLDRS